MMRSFLDTNVLVYADAADEPAKQAVAIALISRLRRDGAGVISTQVLQEYANVAVRKLRLPPALVRERLVFFAGFDVLRTSPDLIQSALDLHIAHGLAFYDALIVQAALDSGCQQLWSEDLQAGRILGKLVIANPFAPTAKGPE